MENNFNEFDLRDQVDASKIKNMIRISSIVCRTLARGYPC